MARVTKGLLWGGVAGIILVAPDGVIMGAITGDFWTWIAGAGAVGAIVGMLVGAAAAKIGPRLVLKPPSGEDNPARR